MNASTQFLLHTSTPLIFPVAAAIWATFRSVRRPGERLETWQRAMLVAAGLGAAWVGAFFLLAPDAMANEIGFPAGNPFQFEIAFTNLGFAAMAFVLVRRHRDFRLAYGVGYAIFLWGAAVGHLDQWFAHGDHQPGNTGGILLVDILVPAAIIALAIADRRRARSHGSPAAVAAAA
ncbi:Integral membrane protein OS=Tsukamurella paurometabola (strain ATCC 8368 / DSM / CCUG 35730/ CIP 100753 / JCM 10117 / KCTC 9821 / NBRC 16120 / NCIMB 702349/ NCTC 13040) OX=521096 GN=Tpau_3222 PE=4 SV=1 [Tsukamurella paurometabola]|uniref:Integral membrane protein n=1 Tax=Tsukamurella paurometabola (strain ATCC 8368 / DSM 20162 / CCUG 35730 / CIP 100753 / JCM 10117 / KCTC 9821 / NBRC 16120 / NCIMB 702349 / NCTC 13040) TaxID=521096 RepID=D5UVM5_TSUPD|nr:DUF6790 family protein [Tsukamurella paurometabola]ADG79807.1 hypothetical protein Tpau_3222 [Tsukamurella paurometabola DSM 20162]SUP37295.1 Uncharacterised protein [Tsukamurella paurometabola]